MERIQSALAKARAAREGKTSALGNSAKRPLENGDPWREIPEVLLDPAVLEKNRIIAHSPAASSANFDVMRTNLLRILRSNGWSRVAITSPNAGCGKTMVALNLAFSLARLSDIRVLVIEFDLRHPSMIAALGMLPGPNFAATLTGPQANPPDLRRWGDNLAFGLTSNPLDSPSELLSAARTAEVIDELEARLRPDVILFDTSPLLVNDDTIAFLDQVDCALMVAAAEETTISDVERCGTDLGKYTQVLGVILNKCRFASAGDDSSYQE